MIIYSYLIKVAVNTVEMSRFLIIRSPLVLKYQAYAAGISVSPQIHQKRTHSYFAKKAKVNRNLVRLNHLRCSSSTIQSPLGTVKVPNENLVEYVWKDSENWLEKTVAVSFLFQCNAIL